MTSMEHRSLADHKRWNILVGWMGWMEIYNVDIDDPPEVKIAALERWKAELDRQIAELKTDPTFVTVTLKAKVTEDGLQFEHVDD